MSPGNEKEHIKMVKSESIRLCCFIDHFHGFSLFEYIRSDRIHLPNFSIFICNGQYSITYIFTRLRRRSLGASAKTRNVHNARSSEPSVKWSFLLRKRCEWTTLDILCKNFLDNAYVCFMRCDRLNDSCVINKLLVMTDDELLLAGKQ